MTGIEKKYLFIFSDGKVEKYVTDDFNLLKIKEDNLFVPNISVDNRLLILETAIYEKIKIQKRLDINEVKLEKSFHELLKELILTKDDRIRVNFNAFGKPPEFIYFNKEDTETHFSWKFSTENAYKILIFDIEDIIRTPLSDFNTIFISNDLVKRNALFNLIDNETWSNRVEKNGLFDLNNKDYKNKKIYTEEERIAKRKSIEIEIGEYGNYEILQKMWQQPDANSNEKIIACRTFLSNYPNSQYSIKIQSQLLNFRWEKANSEKTIGSYLDFIIDCNDDKLKEAAKIGVLNIESNFYKKTVEPLEEKIKKLLVANEKNVEGVENAIIQYKRKSNYFIIGILLALIVGSGISYFLTKNVICSTNNIALKDNPLRKRVDEFVENRIYLKQQQLLEKENINSKIPRSSDEMLEVFKTQENLNKALFDIHKVKFELLPRLDSNKISINEVEKEIFKIENQIN